MERIKYDVVLLDESSIDQQIVLYKQAFEIDQTSSELKPFWEKKHYKNPLGKSLIFGIFVDNELAGMNAYLPSKYSYNDKQILCLQSCESGVNPKFQGKGIWGTIVRYAIDYIFSNTKYEFIFGFPNFRNSYPGFVKMKWETVTKMNNYIMVNNCHRFAHSLCDRKLVHWLAPFFQLQKSLYKLCSIGNSNIVVSECSQNDLIWGRNEKVMSIYPDKDWIEWKTDYKKEKYLKVKLYGNIVATCSYFIDSFEEYQVIRLDKLEYNEAIDVSHKVVISKVISWLCSSYPDAAFVRTWTTNCSKFNQDIKSLMFLKSSHPNPFIIKEKGNEYAKLDWNLSFFDLD